MQINAIGTNPAADKYKTESNFKRLIIEKSAMPIIESMSESDKLEFKQIEERLSKTKFWDLNLSSIKNQFNEFKFKFLHKKGKHGMITDGIYPYDIKGNSLKFYSIIYGPENTSLNNVETLNFKTEKRAEELYDLYKQNNQYIANRRYNISPLESLKMKEFELNMLEEASENSGLRSIRQNILTEFNTKETTGNDLVFRD